MKSAEIRQKFLDYFAAQGHQIVASSSLVPGNDPTLLFTNAGMVQFKDTFLGQEPRPYSRAVSSQRCVRAGGKHNDLENVGYTARHHTFFEMLGNFSFGDYFKKEAIHFAWQFLTRELALQPEKLWITVYNEDDEAAAIWLEDVGVDPGRFSRLGEKDNFWAMGDTGPCGPCSEIFYDHGESVAGGPPGSPDEDGDRYIEIWNLVFMQFDRQTDGSLVPLPRPSVDTGMGLERLAAVLQNVHSNYEIDLFQNLLRAVAAVTSVDDIENTSLRVIADHIRSCSFLIADGVVPSNEGRGYVLRRIIRRAVRHGYQLGVKEIFFYRLVKALADEMGAAYPELVDRQHDVETVLREEEQQFARTLENGMAILNQAIVNLKGSRIPGETVFRLYDTYGFPMDLTADVAREQGLSIDVDGFEQAMEKQRQQARAASQFTAVDKLNIELDRSTQFTGYERLEDEAVVLALYQNGKATETIAAGDDALLILSNSPFYGESGGQVGDRGAIESRDGSAVFEISDTQKQGEHLIHKGSLRQGNLGKGDTVVAKVEQDNRTAVTLNHSATHLLHAALRKVLGEHVTQKGSLVTAERLRFDFSHASALKPEELRQIEFLVNTEILRNSPVNKQVMRIEEARERGALALFGEKYGDEVRVVTVGSDEAKPFSVELCGGTHVARTGDIGLFKLTGEAGIAAGIRRIEAVTGLGALTLVENEQEALKQVCDIVKTSSEGVVDKVRQLAGTARELEKQLEQLKGKLASEAGTDIAGKAKEVKGIQLLTTSVEGFNAKALRDTVDQLKNKLGSAIVVLASAGDGKVSIVAGVTRDLVDRVKAGDLVNMVAQQVGGKGGGRPDMAMAGGSDASSLPQALASVEPWLEDKL